MCFGGLTYVHNFRSDEIAKAHACANCSRALLLIVTKKGHWREGKKFCHNNNKLYTKQIQIQPYSHILTSEHEWGEPYMYDYY